VAKAQLDLSISGLASSASPGSGMLIMNTTTSSRQVFRIGLPLYCSLMFSTSVFAQNAVEGTVQDVVVTTQTDETSTAAVTQQQIQEKQSAPVASTIVTQQQLEAAQITNLQEAQKLQPSLNIKFSNVRNIAINIRGFGATAANATDAIFGGSPVYVNGVYQPFVGQAVFNIPDLVGIEVLKGPQGATGGQDNTGGVVNITTALPSFTLQEKFLFQYGSYNWFQESGSVTGPVAGTDKAAFRISYFNNDQKGYVRSTSSNNLYNGTHDKGAQAMLLLTPTPDLTALLTLNYSTTTQSCCINTYGYAGAIYNYTNGVPFSNSFAARAARVNFSVPASGTLISTYTTSGAGWQNTEEDTYGFSAKIDYNLNGFTFDSVTAFFDWDFHPHNGFTTIYGTGYPVGTGSQITAKSVEQQVSISTPKGGAVEATAGLFYFWDLLIDRAKTNYGPLAGGFFGNPNNTPTINNIAMNYFMYSAYDNPTTNEIAPFIQSVWHATPDFDVTAGLRYTYNIKSSDFAQWDSGGASVSGLSPNNQAAIYKQRDGISGGQRGWYATTHQGILSALLTGTYKFTPNVIGYVTSSLGGRAGGPNPATGNLNGAPTTVKAEHIWNNEVGIKSSWFDQRLILNATAFTMVDYDYIAYQASLLSGTPQMYLANAKRANSRGVELDVRFKPIDDVTTYATMTYDDTFFGSFGNAVCPAEVQTSASLTTCSMTGKPISLIPKWTFVLGGEYSHHLGPLLQSVTDKPLIGYFGSDFTWTSRFFSNYDDSIYSSINPYGILDFHAGIKFEDESWDLSVWAHNTLNKHYYTNIAATTGGEVAASVGAPLEVGMTLRAKF
jgi:iron complex outermembrane receptor protein